MTINITVDEGMVSWDWDIINHSYITILTSSNFNLVLTHLVPLSNQVLRIYYMENFLVVIIKALKYNKVLWWFIYSNDVDDLIFIRYFEG